MFSFSKVKEFYKQIRKKINLVSLLKEHTQCTNAWKCTFTYSFIKYISVMHYVLGTVETMRCTSGKTKTKKQWKIVLSYGEEKTSKQKLKRK